MDPGPWTKAFQGRLRQDDDHFAAAVFSIHPANVCMNF
jgi:hypothetical protein